MKVNSLLAIPLYLGLIGSASAAIDCGPNAPTIDTRQSPYSALQTVHNVAVYSDFEVRNETLSQLAGAYRTKNGIAKLPAGATFKVIYEDGSRECAGVVSATSSLGAVPIPNTQKEVGYYEDSGGYLRNFTRTSSSGSFYAYNICFDYYTNGRVTDTQCSVTTYRF